MKKADLSPTGELSRKAAFGLLSAGCLLALFAGALFVARVLPLLRFPYAVNYGEGVVLDQALRIADGPGLYGPLEKPPYVVDNYTPLYPFLVSLALDHSPTPWYWGRLISFLSVLCAASVLYFLASGTGGAVEEKRLGEAVLCGVTAGGLFLSFGEVQTWAGLVRVDCLGLALSISGFAVTLQGSRSSVLSGSLLFFASLCARQSLIAAPLAAFGGLYLLGDRKRRAAYLGVFLLGGLCFSGLVLAQVLTEGRFWEHTVKANVLPFELSSLKRKYLASFFPVKLPLLLGAGLAFSALRKDPEGRALCMFAVLSPAAALGICRKGADVNYLLVPLAALSALAAYGAYRTHGNKKILIAASLVSQILISGLLERPRVGLSDMEAIAARDRKLLRACAEVKGPMLFEDPALAILAGRPVLYEPFMCTQLARAGRWNPAPLLRQVRAKKFAAVQRTAWIVQKGDSSELFWLGDRMLPELERALAEFYRPEKGRVFTRRLAPDLLEAYLLYVPRR